MMKKMGKTRTGAILCASCLAVGIAFCVNAESLKNTDTVISEEEALEAALDHADLMDEDISRLHTQKDREDGMTVYEIEFETDEREYEYEINAKDGSILKMKSEIPEYLLKKQDSSADRISEEEAREIVLELVPGAEEEDLRIKAERDDGRSMYEGKIVYEEIKYEFDIDAVSGEVLSWEQESVFD